MMSLWWIVFFELGAVGLFVFFLLRRYISWRKTPWYASVLTFLGWFLAMSIAVMLPIDISSTAYEQCLAAQNNSLQGATKVQDQSTQLLSTSSVSLSFNSISYTGQTSASTSLIDNSSESKDFPCFDLLYIEKHILVICWNILYWATFLLCWFVYPVMQSYSTAGDFSIPGKFWTAIKDNIIFYIIGGAVLGLFLVIFLVLSSDGNWFGVAMSCSNAYGLILYLVLLSYGLVLLPRKFWRKGRLQTRLRYCQFHAVNLHRDAITYREQHLKTLQQIKKYDETLEELDPMRDYINIIVKKCPAEYHEVRPLADGDSAISYSSVIKLHYNLKETEHLSNQSQTLFTKLLDTAFYLEDVVNSKGRPEHEVRWTFHKKCPRGFSFIEYLWCCYIKPRTMQFVGLLLALLSLVVVFSEVTFRWDDPTLSVFAILIHPTVVKQSSVLLIAILIGPLLFLVIATYSAFFSLRFFNYFRLIPNQLSSPNSIMFSAAYLCRLGPPLAFNFLYVIKFHGTAFEEVMSYMSDVPFFGGDKFLNNIPWLLVPMCLVSAFDIIPRIIRLLPCRRFTRYVYDDYDETQIEEGEHIIAEERVLKEKSMKCSETISRLTVNSQKDEELGISMDVITSKPDPEPKLAPKLPHCHQQHVESPLPSELKPTDPAPQARFRWFRRGSDDTQQPSLNVIQPNTISEKIERSSRDSPPPLIQEPVKPIPPPTQDKTRTTVTSSNITMHHNKYTNM